MAYDPAAYQLRKAASLARARAWWAANVGNPQPTARSPIQRRKRPTAAWHVSPTILAALQSGRSSRALAPELGVHSTTVARWRRQTA